MGRVTRRGFTLVELLVVVGILAVLVGLLFPVLTRARRKAHEARCQSNLRQLGTALSMYSQDHDGMLPHSWGLGLGGRPHAPYSWRMSILQYVRDVRLFQCPGKRLETPFAGAYPDLADGFHPALGQLSGYAINTVHWGGFKPPTPPGWWFVHESRVELPAETVHVTEGDGPHEFCGLGACAADPRHGFVRNDEAGRRHSGGCNYLFCDGHVKHLKPSQVHCADERCDWSVEDEG